MELSKDYIDKINNTYMFDKKSKLGNLDEILNRNISKYNLSNVKILSNLSYNILLDAYSKKYGNVVIKILMDDNLGYNEMQMLKLYNGKFACKLLEENPKDSFYMLEKITPGDKLASINNLSERTKIICDLISKLVIPYDKKDLNIPFYSELLDNSFKYIKENNKLKILNPHILKCKKLYSYIKSLNLKQYYLHNDLHSYNILKSKKRFVAIDPHGVIGECIFEYSPYIINEFWSNGYDENLFLSIIQNVSKFSNETIFNLTYSTYIHLCMSTIWFLQDNCEDRLFNKNLKILNFLSSKINESNY